VVCNTIVATPHTSFSRQPLTVSIKQPDPETSWKLFLLPVWPTCGHQSRPKPRGLLAEILLPSRPEFRKQRPGPAVHSTTYFFKSLLKTACRSILKKEVTRPAVHSHLLVSNLLQRLLLVHDAGAQLIREGSAQRRRRQPCLGCLRSQRDIHLQ
jgi:hypothetical protein